MPSSSSSRGAGEIAAVSPAPRVLDEDDMPMAMDSEDDMVPLPSSDDADFRGKLLRDVLQPLASRFSEIIPESSEENWLSSEASTRLFLRDPKSPRPRAPMHDPQTATLSSSVRGMRLSKGAIGQLWTQVRDPSWTKVGDELFNVVADYATSTPDSPRERVITSIADFRAYLQNQPMDRFEPFFSDEFAWQQVAKAIRFVVLSCEFVE